jgi:glycogen(starch) synthase
MKILFWSDSFWPNLGGAEVLAVRLLASLRERGHTLAVVANRDWPAQETKTSFEGIPVFRFPFNEALAAGIPASRAGLKDVLALRGQIARLKRDFKPDIVHVHFLGPGVFLHLRTLAACPAPWSVALHNTPTEDLLRTNSLLGHALRAAGWVIVCSQAVLAGTRRLAPDIAAKSSVLLNALDMPPLAPQPLPFHPARLLCLGRIIPEKGFDLAVAALAALRARYPDLRLTIAGGGPALAGLEQQAARLGLGQAVEFAGWVAPERVPGLMNTATVFLMPSRWQEPFGLVALQAAQMARPVVASRVGGLPEIVADGETGLLFENENVGALIEAVTALLDNPAYACSMGEAGRRRAQEHFNWTGYVEAHERLFAHLVRGSA